MSRVVLAFPAAVKFLLLAIFMSIMTNPPVSTAKAMTDKSGEENVSGDREHDDFRAASLQLHSHEQVVMGFSGSREPSQVPFLLPENYQVVDFDVSDSGNVAWVLLDNPYGRGAPRQQRIVWCDLAKPEFRMHTPKLGEGFCKQIRTTPDGSVGWLIVDDGYPQPVQPRREFRLIRATADGSFQVVADTNNESQMGSLGLAQDYHVNPLADGRSVVFTDGPVIWKASELGFVKLFDRKQMAVGSVAVANSSTWKVANNSRWGQLQVTPDGAYWLASINLLDDDHELQALVLGSGQTTNAIAKVRSRRNPFLTPALSPDGTRVAYFHSDEGTIIAGPTHDLQTLAKPKDLLVFGPKFVGQGQFLLCLVRRMGQPSDVIMLHHLDTKQRRFVAHHRMVSGSESGIKMSEDGRWLLSQHNKGELVAVGFGSQPAGGAPEISEVLYQFQDNKLELRLRAEPSDDIGLVSVAYLHQGYLPSIRVLGSSDQPYPSWTIFNGPSVARHKEKPEYFVATTAVQHRTANEIASDLFLVTVQNKSKTRITNYLLRLTP